MYQLGDGLPGGSGDVGGDNSRIPGGRMLIMRDQPGGSPAGIRARHHETGTAGGQFLITGPRGGAGEADKLPYPLPGRQPYRRACNSPDSPISASGAVAGQVETRRSSLTRRHGCRR